MPRPATLAPFRVTLSRYLKLSAALTARAHREEDNPDSAGSGTLPGGLLHAEALRQLNAAVRPEQIKDGSHRSWPATHRHFLTAVNIGVPSLARPELEISGESTGDPDPNAMRPARRGSAQSWHPHTSGNSGSGVSASWSRRHAGGGRPGAGHHSAVAATWSGLPAPSVASVLPAAADIAAAGTSQERTAGR